MELIVGFLVVMILWIISVVALVGLVIAIYIGVEFFRLLHFTGIDFWFLISLPKEKRKEMLLNKLVAAQKYNVIKFQHILANLVITANNETIKSPDYLLDNLDWLKQQAARLVYENTKIKEWTKIFM